MFDTPALMRLAQDMARHAAHRQVVLAQNVAHADTPGFRAQDVQPFAQYLADPAAQGMQANLVDTPDTVAPNGNTVSLERQMMRAAETRQSHDLALSVYSSARGILRTALGR
jgi:flagellar basal-body rod protein FlgB